MFLYLVEYDRKTFLVGIARVSRRLSRSSVPPSRGRMQEVLQLGEEDTCEPTGRLSERSAARAVGHQKTMSTMENFERANQPNEKHGLQRFRWQASVFLNDPYSSNAAFVFFCVITILIVISSVTLCLGTLEEFDRSPSIPILEFICGVAFTVEFVARVLAWQGPRYTVLFDYSMWVDGLSVLPIYIGLLVSAAEGGCDQLGLDNKGGAREHCLPTSLMLLRLVRLLRLLKMLGHYEDSAVLGEALRRAARPLLVPLFFLVLLTFAFAGAIYYAEGVIGGSSDFDNIFKAAWFVLVTLTTVGYGDVYPESWIGKLTASVAIVCGVLCMSMPITIVGNEFHIAWQEREVLQVVKGVRKMLKDRGLQAHEAVLIFNEFDASSGDSASEGVGVLDFVEFGKALECMGIRLPQIRMRQIFNLFDSNGDGYVDFVEFSERLFPELEQGANEFGAIQTTLKQKADGIFSFRRRSSVSLEARQQSAVAEPGRPVSSKTSSKMGSARWASMGPAGSGGGGNAGRDGVDGGASCSSDEAGAHSVDTDERLKSLQESAQKASEALQRDRTGQDAAGNAARLVALEEKMAGLLATSGKMETQLALLCKHFHL